MALSGSFQNGRYIPDGYAGEALPAGQRPAAAVGSAEYVAAWDAAMPGIIAEGRRKSALDLVAVQARQPVYSTGFLGGPSSPFAAPVTIPDPGYSAPADCCGGRKASSSPAATITGGFGQPDAGKKTIEAAPPSRKPCGACLAVAALLLAAYYLGR